MCSLSENAFGARIENGILFIPAELATLAGQGPNLSVEELLSVLHAFPTTFEKGFCWTKGRFKNALDSLVRILDGRVSRDYLHPESASTRHGMGATAPPDAEIRNGYVVPFPAGFPLKKK